jgi:hypothetical protein
VVAVVCRRLVAAEGSKNRLAVFSKLGTFRLSKSAIAFSWVELSAFAGLCDYIIYLGGVPPDGG